MQDRKPSSGVTPSTSAVVIPFTKPITPPAFAEFLGVNVGKVLDWIHSGTLEAHNVAAETTTRPRWRILPSSAEAFLLARASVQPPKQQKRRKKSASGAKEFF